MDTAMPLPKYHQIYLVLREQLQEGRYDVDGVPGEHALAAQFRWPASPSARRWRCWWPTGWCRAGPAWAPRSASRVRRRAARGAEGAADRADGEHRQHGPAHRRARAGLRPGRRAAGGGRGAGDRAGRAGDQEPAGAQHRGRPLSTSPLTCRWPSQPSRARTWSASPADAAGVGRRRVRRRHADHQRPVGRRAGRAASGRGRGLGPAGRDAPGARRQGTSRAAGLYRPDRYQYQLQLSRVGGIDAKVWVSEELSAQFH